MKRYVLTVVAALAVALGAAGGVLAGNAARSHRPKAHPRVHVATHPTPSLMPSLAPPAQAWAKALHTVPHKRAPEPHKRPARPQPVRHHAPARSVELQQMARQWAELARIARSRYHRSVRFAGVMTQGGATCDCGLRPPAAHRVLAYALDDQAVGHVGLPDGGTNIVG